MTLEKIIKQSVKRSFCADNYYNCLLIPTKLPLYVFVFSLSPSGGAMKFYMLIVVLSINLKYAQMLTGGSDDVNCDKNGLVNATLRIRHVMQGLRRRHFA